MCPVCAVAAGAGLGLARYIGIDDSVAGLWAGAFVISLIVWTNNIFKKHNWQWPMQSFLFTLIYMALVLGPLYYKGVIGHISNTLWGVDKFGLGTIIGAAAFAGAAAWYISMKEKNGKPHFPFERVVLPVGALVLLSVVFYYITKK